MPSPPADFFPFDLFFQLANSAGLIIVAIWVKPLREARQRMGVLEKQISEMNLAALRQTIAELQARMKDITCSAEECKVAVVEQIKPELELQIVREVNATALSFSQALERIHQQLTNIEKLCSSLEKGNTTNEKQLGELFSRLSEVEKGLANLAGRQSGR